MSKLTETLKKSQTSVLMSEKPLTKSMTERIVKNNGDFFARLGLTPTGAVMGPDMGKIARTAGVER